MAARRKAALMSSLLAPGFTPRAAYGSMPPSPLELPGHVSDLSHCHARGKGLVAGYKHFIMQLNA